MPDRRGRAAALPATLIPGDGIGPEITAAVTRVLDALGAPFAWERQQGGLAAIEESGDPLPAALVESIRRTKLALKGPLTTPVGGGFRSVNVRCGRNSSLRELRPARTMVQAVATRTSTSCWSARTSRAFT